PTSDVARDHPDQAGKPQLLNDPQLVYQSYAYLGWAFDNVKKSSRLNQFHALQLLLPGSTVTGNPWVPTQVGAALEGFAKDPVKYQALANIAGNGEGSGLAAQEMIDDDSHVVYGDDRQWAGVGNGGSDYIYRLREGVERFMVTDINNPGATAMAQSKLFVMFDLMGTGGGSIIFNHIPGGCNILFMDGHVEFAKYIGLDVANIDDPLQVEQAMGGCTDPVLPTLAMLLEAFGAK
ncbi:MAG: hypothetical protein NTU83_12175, partial [Candidatus Hydrogenedentes bacterium]|nr:hypothetical protein [Candidatus Hydrogenedentota bacterium]